MSAETYMNNSLQVVQRLRELSVQGANGTYTPDDLKDMAAEADELLKEHHQQMSPLKRFAYRHIGRHLMNRNNKKIRNA